MFDARVYDRSIKRLMHIMYKSFITVFKILHATDVCKFQKEAPNYTAFIFYYVEVKTKRRRKLQIFYVL